MENVKKFFSTLLKIILSLFALPLGIAVSVLLIPFASIYCLVAGGAFVLELIWE